MNIIDTNGISYIFEKNLILRDSYYLVPDVEEEAEMTQLIHNKRLPSNILRSSQITNFDEAVYLKHYKDILNKYGGRSFFNMTGFGDVSILATLLMLVEVFDKRVQKRLFPNDDQIVVYTKDQQLSSKIKTELANKNVIVRPVTDIV